MAKPSRSSIAATRLFRRSLCRIGTWKRRRTKLREVEVEVEEEDEGVREKRMMKKKEEK